MSIINEQSQPYTDFLTNASTLTHSDVEALASDFSYDATTHSVAVNFFGGLSADGKKSEDLQGLIHQVVLLIDDPNSSVEQQQTAESVHSHLFYVETTYLFEGLSTLSDNDYNSFLNTDEKMKLFSGIILDQYLPIEQNPHQFAFLQGKSETEPEKYQIFNERIAELKAIQAEVRTPSPVFDTSPRTEVKNLSKPEMMKKLGLHGASEHNPQVQAAIKLQEAVTNELIKAIQKVFNKK